MRTTKSILPQASMLAALFSLVLLLAPSSLAAVPDDAKWDAQFTGQGLNGVAEEIAVKGTDVYLGGSFTKAGGIDASRIVRWDTKGKTWWPLGSGLGNTVVEMTLVGTHLYVGGDFNKGDGSPGDYLAMWDTVAKSWSAIPGPSLNDRVRSLAVKGTDLYVGGMFTQIGAVNAKHIAKLDTKTNTWSAVGDGVDDTVRAIAVKGNDVFVGGNFAQATNQDATTVTANGIAKWSTTLKKWFALGSGVSGGSPSMVLALAFKGTDLYVGGDFGTAGPISANHIAKWSTKKSQWSALGNGADDQVNTLAFRGGDLIVGGVFTHAGGNSADKIACWNGTAWDTGLSGVTGATPDVEDLGVIGSVAYVVGAFDQAGGVSVNNVAGLDEAHWTWFSLGNGANNAVFALATKGGDIYAGGDFTQMGGMNVSHVARFSTASNQWYALGGGVNGSVYALAVKGTDVYVGGAFATAFNPGGIPVAANNVAVWSITKKQWSALVEGGTINGVQGNVYALATTGNTLFVAGAFTQVGPNTANRVASWDIKNKKWDHLLEGLNDEVYALAIYGRYVFAGGAFTSAGSIATANHVAAFDTKANSWSVLGNDAGNGVDGPVYTIAFTGSYIWLGGDFHTVYTPGGNSSHDYIFAGNMNPPHDEIDVGETNGPVRALLPVGSRTYVAGEFTKTDPGDPSEKTVNYIAWGSKVAGWAAMGSGLDNFARALTTKGKDIYVGGLFQTAGDKPSLSIAHWIGP